MEKIEGWDSQIFVCEKKTLDNQEKPCSLGFHLIL